MDPAVDVIGRCFFCRKARLLRMLDEAPYQPDLQALPISVLICRDCATEAQGG